MPSRYTGDLAVLFSDVDAAVCAAVEMQRVIGVPQPAVYLVDHSTNGTFIKHENGDDIHLVR